jgi:hypothetical protein
MDRRNAMAKMGAAGVLAASGAAAQPERAQVEQWERCTGACYSCAAACNAAILGLADEGDKQASAALRACLDCAEACACAAGFCSRRSSKAGAICAACARVCDECVKACTGLKGKPIAKVLAAAQECARFCRGIAE